MSTLGRHIVVEYYDCPAEVLDDVVRIEKGMEQAALTAGATIINSSFHHFSPYGVSGVIVIQESHLAIHTWPEYGYAAVDIFTCGEPVDPWVCYQVLKEALEAGNGSAMELGRGQVQLLPHTPKQPLHASTIDDRIKEDPQYKRNIWFTERDDAIALSLRHKGDVLFREQSELQRVEVYDTYAYGKMLTLDGMVMTTEVDEYVYHEMITHVPMLVHPDPKRVLVIGGGDGGAVREILRHPGVEEVVMVEIDEVVIRASREHLPEIASALDHPKLSLKVEDGIQYVTNAPENSFDLVIVDSTDPVGPGEGLFSETFYMDVHRILKSDGIQVTQSESPRFNTKVMREIYDCYRRIFGQDKVFCYLINVPTYPSGTWSLSFSVKGDLHPLNNLDENRAAEFTQEHKLRYYNDQVHRAAFALPGFVQQLIGLDQRPYGSD